MNTLNELDIAHADFDDLFKTDPQDGQDRFNILVRDARLVALRTEFLSLLQADATPTSDDFDFEISQLCEKGVMAAISEGRVTLERIEALSRNPDALNRVYHAIAEADLAELSPSDSESHIVEIGLRSNHPVNSGEGQLESTVAADDGSRITKRVFLDTSNDLITIKLAQCQFDLGVALVTINQRVHRLIPLCVSADELGDLTYQFTTSAKLLYVDGEWPDNIQLDVSDDLVDIIEYLRSHPDVANTLLVDSLRTSHYLDANLHFSNLFRVLVEQWEEE